MAQTGKLPSGDCFHQKEMIPCSRSQTNDKVCAPYMYGVLHVCSEMILPWGSEPRYGKLFMNVA